MGGNVPQQLIHGDEHPGVIGGRGKHQVAIPKCRRQNVRRWGHGGVKHLHLYPLLRQAAGQDIGRALRVAVDGGVGDHHAPHLRLIPAPQVVLAENIAQVPAPYKAVQRQDHPDLQPRRLLQHRLHLGTVFAHDVGVVPAALVQIIPVKIHLVGKEPAVQRAEAAEGIRRQQQLVGPVVGHHHLGPVDHGGHDKLQGVPSGAEGIPLLAHMDAVVIGMAEELTDHGLGHGGTQDLHLREPQHQVLQLGGVIGFHMVHHDVVQGTAIQAVVQVFPELPDHLGVHRVKEHGFFIQQQVAVVGNALRHAEYALKHRQAPAVRADPGVVLIHFSDTVHIASSRFRIFPHYNAIKSQSTVKKIFPPVTQPGRILPAAPPGPESRPHIFSGFFVDPTKISS